jgi:hypothetical protein
MAYALIGDIRCAISSRASLMSEATCRSPVSGTPNTATKTSGYAVISSFGASNEYI